MPNVGDAGVGGRGHGVALGLVFHGAELADSERFTVFSNAFLKEKNRSFRVNFDADADDEQGPKEHD